MWYNVFVRSATFFFLPAAVLTEDGAFPPMPVLNVVLPIPSPSLRSAFPCFPFLYPFPCHTFEITTVVDRRPRTGRERQTLRRYFTYPLSVQLLAHSFARRKKQLSSFQSFPHSLPKNTGGGGYPFLLSSRLASRLALSLAYLILATAYFLLGSIGAPWLAPVRAAVPPVVFVGFILILPALGISMVKPCVVGTTARASKENVRSIGYSIYYTMVNIGGASGPYVASWAHRHLGVENVFRVAALSVFLMFFAVLIFFREPKRTGDAPPPSVSETLKNFLTVLGNPKFMLFLLIFTGYWIVFWQQYITLPGYIHGYISAGADVELILITDGLSVICLTVLINYLIRKLPAFQCVILGTLITSLSWLVLAFQPTVLGVVLSIFVLVLGEMIQAPR